MVGGAKACGEKRVQHRRAQFRRRRLAQGAGQIGDCRTRRPGAERLLTRFEEHLDRSLLSSLLGGEEMRGDAPGADPTPAQERCRAGMSPGALAGRHVRIDRVPRQGVDEPQRGPGVEDRARAQLIGSLLGLIGPDPVHRGQQLMVAAVTEHR